MLAPIGSIRCPLLIGRDDLLDLVDRRLDDVAAGHGQFLLLAGEAGIGKTRLLDAVRRKAGVRDMPVAVGSVAPQDREVPAASILDLARTMRGLDGLETTGTSLLALVSSSSPGLIGRRRMVMDAVDLIIDALPGPTMLGFEDLQWADDLSLEIIGELARRARTDPLLIVADYRIEDVPPGTSLRDWRVRLITQRIAEEVRLRPLTREETALATSLILDTGLPASREVAAAVYERTDGIPLHIEELLGALSAEARADGSAIRDAQVPETIDDAVLARMAYRSTAAQAAARAGAVIGRCFAPEVLAGIMDLPIESLEAPLQELVDHMVLAPMANGYYDYRHQLLRDVLYRTIPNSERRRFHARAGEFGASLEGASEIHASVHYERAGLRRQAFDAAVASAREASLMYAHRQSFALYRRAIANVPDDLDPIALGELFEAYSDEASAIDDSEVGERAAREAMAAYRAGGQPAKAFVMGLQIANFWRREARPMRDRARLLEELEEELAALPAGPDREDAAVWLGELVALFELDSMDVAAARPRIERMRAAAIERGDDEEVLAVDANLGMLEVLEGRLDAGLERMGATARAGRDAGYGSIGVTTFRNAALFAARDMRYDEARIFLAEGQAYAETIEQSHCAHMMSALSSMVDWAGADWDDAATTARQTIADQTDGRAVAMADTTLGFIAMGRGDLPEAERELTIALDAGEASGWLEMILPPLWGLAEAAVLRGDPVRAIGHVRDAFERACAVHELALLAPFVVTGVRAYQAAGQPSDAEAWFAECEVHLASLPTVTEPALHHGRGLVALAAGSTGIARQELDAAVRGWEACGRVWEATWARLDLASCLSRMNRFAEAVDAAADARAMAARLGSEPLAERAEMILRMARGHVASDEPWRPLTAREFAVARLISDGLTNAEIAAELGIAPKTASSHVEHILAKLGASRRAEIAAWASRVEPSLVAR
jgi:DNA-binding CsgD family transcriptional regulator